MSSLSLVELKERLEIVEDILNRSSHIMLEGYSNNPGAKPAQLTRNAKTSFSDLVTEFDKKVEEFILHEMEKNFPEERVVGEESSYGKQPKSSEMSKVFWALDPIDGTTNFARSYPYFCTTIALLEKSDQDTVILAATLDPVRNEFFSALKGGGAFMNEERIHVSAISKMQEALFVTGFAAEREKQKDVIYERFAQITRTSLGVRRTGSAALDLAYVACGRLDGYWECGLSIWDLAAGALLVEEAGGRVSHFERETAWSPWSGEILATNTLMHEELKRKLS